MESNLEHLKEKIMSNKKDVNEDIIRYFDSCSVFKLHTILWIHGETPLHWAAAGQNNELLRYLLKRGMWPDQNNFRGTTALYYACMQDAGQNIESIELLLNYGANPAIRSGFSGHLPMKSYEENKNSEEYKILRKNYDERIPVGYIESEPSYHTTRREIGFHLTQSTRYRLYMYELMVYNEYMKETSLKCMTIHEGEWKRRMDTLKLFSDWMRIKCDQCPCCMRELNDVPETSKCINCKKVICCKEHREFVQRFHNYDCRSE